MLVPNFHPESDDTRWKLQQGVIFTAGYVFAFFCAALVFWINDSDNVSPWICWFRSQISMLLALLPSALFYKVVKRDRLLRGHIAKEAKLADENLALSELIVKMARDVGSMANHAPQPSGERAKVMVDRDMEGHVLESEMDFQTPAELLEVAKAKHANKTLSVDWIDLQLPHINGKESFKSVRLYLLTRRGELMGASK